MKGGHALPASMDPRSRFGYFATLGIDVISQKRRSAVATMIAHSSSAHRGAAAAMRLQPKVDPTVQRIIQSEDMAWILVAASNRWGTSTGAPILRRPLGTCVKPSDPRAFQESRCALSWRRPPSLKLKSYERATTRTSSSAILSLWSRGAAFSDHGLAETQPYPACI